MGVLAGQVERLRAAHGRVVELRSRLEAAAPPPPEPNPEHDWVAGEVLAHLAEMLPYWLGEVERVLDGPTEPVPFGRVSGDAVRTLTVDRDRTLPVDELLARIAAGVDRASARLGQLDERAASRRGLHPRLGEMTVADIVERFMAGHLEEHAGQLAEAVGAG